MATEREILVNVSSGYGANTRRPFVSLQIADLKPLQISPEEARAIAANLLECAEAADQDAFLVEWFTGKFELPMLQAAMILDEYRTARKERSR